MAGRGQYARRVVADWDRFWAKVQIGGEDECWPWTEGTDDAGYGMFQIRGTVERSHRAAFLMTGGELLPGDMVCHSCDNPPCCNQKHLFRSDHDGNMLDARTKGRMNQGSRNFAAVLDEDRVREIRVSLLAGMSRRTLAVAYGVSYATICQIASGRTWRHVTVSHEEKLSTMP